MHTNKYIEYLSIKPTTISMRRKGQTNMRAHKQQCAHNNEDAIDFPRKQEHERFTSKTFVTLFVLE